MVKLKKEVEQGQASTVLIGGITTDFHGKGPIVVVAYAMNQGIREVEHYTVLHDYGEFELMVREGKYFVFAYWDKNTNLVYDAGEPAGQHGDPKMVSAPTGGVVGGISIAITQKELQTVEVPYGFEISSVKPPKLNSRLAGAIAELNDELFDNKHGRKGFWEYVSFFKEYGGNIYFLEEYDPKKIPILFIHGFGGTPHRWRYFVDSMDRTRFQPWFFYYPTGARIQSMSSLLFWKLHTLKTKYHFDHLYITAHSMGGLLARSFILDYGAHFPYVKLFVSLATPWGGVKLAEYGVKRSPAVIPSWIDLQPESVFIQSLFRTKMPESVSFYMFSGHQGSRNPFRRYNDGFIALSSLLDSRPQAEAEMNYVFNENHVSIIYSKAVLNQYNTIINTFYQKESASSQRSGGYLKVHFSYSDPLPGVRPRPSLVLQPIGKKNAETEISIGGNETGRILGPFPPGEYLAFFGTLTSFDRNSMRVLIKDNETSKLKYVLTPDNVIRGHVRSTLKPKDWEAGMPYEEIRIESITLKNAKIHRKIHLVEGADINLYDFRIPRVDHCYKGEFIIYGLPPGEYKLIIRAQGYMTFIKKCYVKSRREIIDPIVVKLTPESEE